MPHSLTPMALPVAHIAPSLPAEVLDQILDMLLSTTINPSALVPVAMTGLSNKPTDVRSLSWLLQFALVCRRWYFHCVPRLDRHFSHLFLLNEQKSKSLGNLVGMLGMAREIGIRVERFVREVTITLMTEMKGDRGGIDSETLGLIEKLVEAVGGGVKVLRVRVEGCNHKCCQHPASTNITAFFKTLGTHIPSVEHLHLTCYSASSPSTHKHVVHGLENLINHQTVQSLRRVTLRDLHPPRALRSVLAQCIHVEAAELGSLERSDVAFQFLVGWKSLRELRWRDLSKVGVLERVVRECCPRLELIEVKVSWGGNVVPPWMEFAEFLEAVRLAARILCSPEGGEGMVKELVVVNRKMFGAIETLTFDARGLTKMVLHDIPEVLEDYRSQMATGGWKVPSGTYTTNDYIPEGGWPGLLEVDATDCPVLMTPQFVRKMVEACSTLREVKLCPHLMEDEEVRASLAILKGRRAR